MSIESEVFRNADRKLVAVLSGVTDWSIPSPCDGWTALDVLDHLIDTQRDFLQDHSLDAGNRPTTAGNPVSAWQAHSAIVQGILDDPDAAGKAFDGFFGPTTVGETLGRFYGFDMIVHRWDIAQSAGLAADLSDAELDAVEVSLNGFGEHLYMEGICKPALDVPAGADRETRLLARMGRGG